MEFLAILFVVIFGSVTEANKVAPEPVMTTESHVAHWEGYRSKAYQDIAGIWTIGYGQTTIDGRPVQEGDMTDKADAQAWLITRITQDEAFVRNYGEKKGYEWDNCQVAALTSFVYNVGKGKLNQLARGGLRSNEQITEAMMLYTKAGGKHWRGLENRRVYEVALFNSCKGN